MPITGIDDYLFELALDVPERLDLVKIAATMSFRGARPESKTEWEAKLVQIEELVGNARG